VASNVLTTQHLSDINDAISKLEEAQKEIALAERAGLHSGPGGTQLVDYKRQVEDSMARLKQIKAVYFPNQ
jgi:hypothetical protein